MLMGPLSGRRGHKPSELTAPSSSFTAAITNSYVCAIEKLRHSTFRTLSNLLRVKTPDTGNSKLVSTSQLSKIGWIVRSSTCNCLNQSRRLMTAVTILPAATTTEVIGALEVAIRVIKGVARAEHRVVAMVIQAAVCVRAANSKVDQEEKTPVSTLLRYVCLNIISVRINLTTNNRKQFKRPASVICSCSTSNMVFMTPQSPPRSFAQLLRLWRKQLLPCPHEPYTLIHSMNACPLC
jgi:hypothetical protein